MTPFLKTDNIPPLMQGTSSFYRGAARLAHGLLPLAGALNAKVRRGHHGRRNVVERIEQWSRRKRETGRPLVWFHAPSVGEGLQAESVLRTFTQRHSDWQVAYTFSSPSAERLGQRLSVDVVDYLPYDLPSDVDRALNALDPRVLVFTKLDLWPELATRAARQGATVVIAAATVRPSSGRLRWPVRVLVRPGYAAVHAAGAISSDDGERLTRLGVRVDAVTVIGDPRFDSVAHERDAVDPNEPLLQLGKGATTLVAGSTWPGDERVLLSAFARVRQAHPDARLILVPHEPTERHLQQVASVASRLRLPSPTRLSRIDDPTELVVVDRVGVLASLYGAGDMAYVGGGFGRAGLHSVLEPAAWSVPVVFGPRWQESRDAHLLTDAGAARHLAATETGQATAQLTTIWERWLTDAEARREEGRRARQVIDRERGASERMVDLIDTAVGQTASGSGSPSR